MSSVDIEKPNDAPVTLNTNEEVAVVDKDINPQSTEWNTTSDVNPAAVSETGMVEEAKESLEAYLSILEAAGTDGISRQTQAVMNVHLRQLDRTLGYTKITPALEHIDASPRSALYKSTISVEDIKDRLSNAGTKIKEMFEKLMEWIKEQISGGMAKLEQLKAAGIALKDKIAKMLAPTPEEIPVSNQALFVDNKVELGFTSDTRFLQWYNTNYIPWVGKGIALVGLAGGDDERLQQAFDQWVEDAPLADNYISGNVSLEYKSGTGRLQLTKVLHEESTVYQARTKDELAKCEADSEKFNTDLVATMNKVQGLLDQASKVYFKVNALSQGADFALSILQKVIGQDLVNITSHMSSTYFVKLKQVQLEVSKASSGTDEKKNLSENQSAIIKNLVKFIDEKDIDHVRAALSMTISKPASTSADAVEGLKLAKASDLDIFVPYQDVPYTKPLETDKEKWTEDYLNKCEVYLDTNFAEERFKHMIQVMKHLGR